MGSGAVEMWPGEMQIIYCKIYTPGKPRAPGKGSEQGTGKTLDEVNRSWRANLARSIEAKEKGSLS
jgi:hypothetical protein